jgi:hypothetical protein
MSGRIEERLGKGLGLEGKCVRFEWENRWEIVGKSTIFR